MFHQLRGLIPFQSIMDGDVVNFDGQEVRTNDETMRIAAIPGDGIGKEVLPEGIRVLQAAAERWASP